MKATRPFLLLCVAALLCVSAMLPAGAQTQGERATVPTAAPSHYFALIIGNNVYRNVPHLKTAENDARSVEAILRERYGFQTKLLLNATRQQIIAALNSYRRQLDADANLLIYYAGHGVNDKEIDKAYWLPVDAELNDNSNWISADDITSNIRGIPAKHVLIVSDSCYSGTLTRGLEVVSSVPAVRERYLQKMSAGRSRTLMASGGNEPVADEGGVGNHSVFASALVRGLQETEKNVFTASELYREYVEENVAGRASQTPEYNPLRNSGHESGDFVFVRVKTADGKTVEVTVKTTAGAVDPAAVELSFWETIKGSSDPEDFKAYLKQYPSGQFAALANNRIANLEASAKTTPTPAVIPAPADSSNSASELAFWEEVKGSTNADDFRAYLKRFPNGAFADLANNKLKVLEKDEETKRKADDNAKRTKIFKGVYTTLVVSPANIESVMNKTGERQQLECSSFDKAELDKSAEIINFSCPEYGTCKFFAMVKGQAASVLNYIREVCNSSAQVTPTGEVGADSLDGTTWEWKESSSYKYEYHFLAGGQLLLIIELAKGSHTEFSGTWTQVGNDVSIVEFLGGKHTDTRQGTLAGNKLTLMTGTDEKGRPSKEHPMVVVKIQ